MGWRDLRHINFSIHHNALIVERHFKCKLIFQNYLNQILPRVLYFILKFYLLHIVLNIHFIATLRTRNNGSLKRDKINHFFSLISIVYDCTKDS